MVLKNIERSEFGAVLDAVEATLYLLIDNLDREDAPPNAPEIDLGFASDAEILLAGFVAEEGQRLWPVTYSSREAAIHDLTVVLDSIVDRFFEPDDRGVMFRLVP